MGEEGRRERGIEGKGKGRKGGGEERRERGRREKGKGKEGYLEVKVSTIRSDFQKTFDHFRKRNHKNSVSEKKIDTKEGFNKDRKPSAGEILSDRALGAVSEEHVANHCECKIQYGDKHHADVCYPSKILLFIQ